MAERARHTSSARGLTPRRALAGLVVLLLLLVLLRPPPESAEAPALSSYNVSSNGARGLYEVLARLGFSVERRLTPLRDSLDAMKLYVVLDPPIDLTVTEVNQLLATVRGGGGLIAVPPLESRLADSLGVDRAMEVAVTRSGRGGRPRLDTTARLGPGWVRWVLRSPRLDTLPYQPPAGAQTFLSIGTSYGREPMIVGMPFGRGRVVLLSDPDLLRNSVVREGNGAARIVRLIEWVSQGTARPIVFDEYHHGFGTHADLFRIARRTLLQSGAGRVLLQLCAAGLVLLVALAVRPIRPAPRARIERRSPLEHVGALARAYRAVHASARATHLLVRGLQRRHGNRRVAQDGVTYLRRITQQHAELADDAAVLNKAMAGGADATATRAVPSAIVRIERVITS